MELQDGLHPIDVHVGQQLRALRQQARLTQAQLARGLGVTFQQVQKYEKGVNRMAASTLAKASATIGCTIADFYPKDEVVDPQQAHQNALEELAALYGRMGLRQREALLMTARAMADRPRRPELAEG